MKKILSVILASAMLCTSALMFSACGSTKTSGSASGDSSANDTDATEAASNGELHMATNAFFEPYEYYDGDTVVGIDAEIAQAICDKLGYTLVIDDMDFDSIITAVQSGKADFGMAGMTVTEERLQAIDFTDTYAKTTQVIIVNENDSKVANADDLETATIGVQLGTTGDIFVSDLKNAKIERFNKGADAVLALTSGKVDAVVIDNEPAKAFVAQNEGTKILDDPFAEEEYAICVAKGSDLTQKINDALNELKADGTVDKIIDKYIGD